MASHRAAAVQSSCEQLVESQRSLLNCGRSQLVSFAHVAVLAQRLLPVLRNAAGAARDGWSRIGDFMLTARENQSALLGMAALATPLPGSTLTYADLLTNNVFMSGFWAFFLAQFGKLFTERFKKGVWDIKALTSSGGMPSSHSSLCAGVTTAIGVAQGLGSPLFAAACTFSVIVMYDAMGVRRHAGLHAQVLNRVVYEISDARQLGSIADVQLKEVLGHTPRQVLAGALLGIAVGLLYPSLH